MKCPNCRKETTWQDNPSRPFCSELCKLIDLGNWADGAYSVKNQSLLDSDEQSPTETLSDEDITTIH